MNRRMTGAVLGAVLLTTAACGTTVPMGEQVTYNQGLNGSAAPGGAAGTGGSGLGGAGLGGTGSAAGAGGAGGSQGAGTTSGGSSSTGGQATGGMTGSTGQGGAGAPIAKGSPVEIGFVTTSVGNAASLGVSSGSSYSDKQMYAALVAEYNKAGGLAGHQIKPVYAATDTGGNAWANQFAAACSTFTEDNHVQAVVGYLFAFFLMDAPWQLMVATCITSAGVGIGYAAMPTLILESVPLAEAGSAVGINGLVRSIGTSVSSAAMAAILTAWTLDLGGYALPTERAFAICFGVGAAAAFLGVLLAALVPRARAAATH